MERVMKATRRQCQLALFSALVVVVCVCIGVTMNLTTIYDENFDHMGLRTFCMFTVNSNILAAAAMAMVIPYTLDGLRKHNYHMPRWIVVLVYAGVTAVALTFLVSLFILAPYKGFKLIFTGSRFFLHGVCPVLAIIAFCFFMSAQKVRFVDSLIALIPVLIYAIIYTVMVLVVGHWDDFYGFFTKLPVWVPLVAIMPLTLLIATVIRLLHNRAFNKREKEETAFFIEAFTDADVPQLVGAMARFHAKNVKSEDIHIPARIISIMLEYNKGEHTLEECCEIYLKEYFASRSVMELDKLWI